MKNRKPEVRNREDIIKDPTAHRRSSEKYRKKNEQLCIERTKKCQRQNKIDVMKKYGNKCECCSETHIEFLTIDHKNGQGQKHREKVTNGHPERFYRYLIKAAIDPTLRVLCMNCNWVIRNGAICPHQLNK